MRNLIRIVEDAALPPREQCVPTEGLPKRHQREAELTIDYDDYNADEEGELLWHLEDVNPAEVTSGWDSLQFDEKNTDYCIKIANDMKQNGQKRPVFLGPNGIEGNHRLWGATLVGLPKLKAWVAYRFPWEDEG